MEDAHLAVPNFIFEDLPDASLFGVFDGHGGPAVSAWVAKVFDTTLREEMTAVKAALQEKKIVPQTE